MSFKTKKIEWISNVVICVIVSGLLFFSFYSNDKEVESFSYKDEVYYQGDRNSNYVSLMFNVYWGEEYLEEILSTLKLHNVKATFFMGGSFVDDHVKTLKTIFDAGHEIANHGYFHKDQGKLSYDKNYEEINNTNILIEKIINKKPVLFAPPSGDYSSNTVLAAKKLNMKVIMWSIDTIDWRDQDEKLIFNRTKDVKGGDLILLHPTKCTAMALNNIILNIKNKYLSIVEVSKNIENFEY